MRSTESPAQSGAFHLHSLPLLIELQAAFVCRLGREPSWRRNSAPLRNGRCPEAFMRCTCWSVSVGVCPAVRLANRAELYRERVVELRARAEKFRGGTRSQLLILAEIWERLARIAESQYALIDSPGVDDVEPKDRCRRNVGNRSSCSIAGCLSPHVFVDHMRGQCRHERMASAVVNFRAGETSRQSEYLSAMHGASRAPEINQLLDLRPRSRKAKSQA